MKTYVIGDVHLRYEEPFFSVTQDFLDKLVCNAEPGATLIFTGDFFHRARPYAEELRAARTFFEVCKLRKLKVVIVAGNHEYFRDRGTWAEDVFKTFDLDFIEHPTVDIINDSLFLFLPWTPVYLLKKEGCDSMRDYYAKVLADLDWWNLKGFKRLFVVYHFEDETVFTGAESIGVDLSVIGKFFENDIVRFGGHIHNPDSNYIGSPYATRSDETGFARRFAVVEKDGSFEYQPLPIRTEFKTLMYSELETTQYDPAVKYIIKVLDAPSFEAVKAHVDARENVWLDDYDLKFSETRSIADRKDDERRSIRDFLALYIKQNKVDANTANYLLSVF